MNSISFLLKYNELRFSIIFIFHILYSISIYNNNFVRVYSRNRLDLEKRQVKKNMFNII